MKILSTLLGFLLAITLARLLGPEGYGTYSLALSILTLAAIPLLSGMPHLLVRETARALAEGNRSLPRALWDWNTRLLFLLALLLCAIALVIWLNPRWINSPRRETISIGLLLAPLLALLATQGAMMRGLGHVLAGQLPHMIMGPAFFLMALFVTTATLSQLQLSPHLVFSLQICTAILAWVVTGLLLSRMLPGTVHYNIDDQQRNTWLRSLLPLTLVAGFQILNGYADILLLGLLRSDQDVGIYRVAVQLSGLVAFGLAAINQVLHPRFARLYAANDHAELQKLVTRSARLILLIAIPPVVIFFAAGEMLLGFLFGSQYLGTITALKILAVGQLVNAAFGSVGALLNMTGHEKDTMKGMIIAAVVNVLLNLLLIPRYGPEGAAVATATSYLVWNWLLRSFVKKRLNIESAGWKLNTT